MSELQKTKLWDSLSPLSASEVEMKLRYSSDRAGFPRCTTNNGCPLSFELILFNGERVTAFVDESHQYTCEGSLWIRKGKVESVSRYQVVAWKEIEE